VEESIQTGGWRRAFRQEGGGEHSDRRVEESIQTAKPTESKQKDEGNN
jgi:hypothetical protein